MMNRHAGARPLNRVLIVCRDKHHRQAIRKNHGRNRPALFAILNGQFRRISIKLAEACPRVREANPSALRRPCCRQSRTVILNFHHPRARR